MNVLATRIGLGLGFGLWLRACNYASFIVIIIVEVLPWGN